MGLGYLGSIVSSQYVPLVFVEAGDARFDIFRLDINDFIMIYFKLLFRNCLLVLFV